MEASRGGLVVEELTPVRQRTGFEELAGVAQGRPVSVGITDAGLFGDEASAAAFAEAAQAAQRVEHPAIARTLAVDATGERRFAVLWERAAGPTVDRVLRERGPLPADEAVPLVAAVAEALGAAHRHGVLHGDVTAEWVTLDAGPRGPEARLAGFGLGLLSAFTGGRRPTVATDIAGLGALLHQLLTGALPHGRLGDLPPAATHLGSVLSKCLGFAASDRYRTVAEFEHALTEVGRTRVSGGHVVAPGEKRGAVALRTLGPWELEGLLGEGAMGQVFRARHKLLGRQAAIKVLRPEQYQREDLIQRFFQEARSVNQINHEHIVEISDFGQELGADGHPVAVYFVMELLQGETLSARLARGPLAIERTLHIVRQLASALAAAHRLGVVHRDVKSDNVFLIRRQGDDAYVKMLDFGVAKLTQPTFAAPTVSTMDGAIIGTPTSMSPEQASGAQVDARADVYAVGVLLYLMLSGKLPIDADSFGKLVALLLTAQPAPLPAQSPGGEPIPGALAALVMRCLEKDPAKRPQSMEALLEALAAAPGPPAPASRPSRLGRIAAAALVLAGVAAGAAYLFRPQWGDAASPDAGAEPALVALPEEDAGPPEPADAAVAGPDAGREGPPPKGLKPPRAVQLTPALVQAALNRDKAAILRCIERYRTSLPGTAGSLPVRWTVELNGSVSNVALLDPSLQGTPLESCLVKTVKALTFPRHLGPPRTMTMPFTYRGRE